MKTKTIDSMIAKMAKNELAKREIRKSLTNGCDSTPDEEAKSDVKKFFDSLNVLKAEMAKKNSMYKEILTTGNKFKAAVDKGDWKTAQGFAEQLTRLSDIRCSMDTNAYRAPDPFIYKFLSTH